MTLTRFVLRKFSSSTVPLKDLTSFLTEIKKLPASFRLEDLPFNVQSDCKDVALALHEFGSLAIKDPRSNPQDNEAFLDVMEDYFKDRSSQFYKHNDINQLPDCFPQNGFVIGVTPEYQEIARDHTERIETLPDQHSAGTPTPLPKDAKWRYMYPIGDTFQDDTDLAPEKHIPEDYPQMENLFEAWGNTLLDASNSVAQMAALGMGFENDFFTERLRGGQHLLAPTGSDLKKHAPGTVFASFHYDFNFLTVHGKSRYPGLFIWLRDGSKIPVVVPDGHLLLQSGRQFEMLTGGYIQNGFHEVLYTDATKQKYDSLLETKGENQWRVSSTLFQHIRLDVDLSPQREFRTEDSLKKYPPMTALDLLEEELRAINLWDRPQEENIHK